MKIGIAGYGFVGKAHELVLKDYHDLIIYDPALEHYGDLRHADAIIICVSTPQGSHGGCHMDNVYCIIEDNPNVPILIKSTISVEGWKMLEHVFPHTDIAFSPEFLRAAHWETDAQLQDKIYLGGGNTGFWADIFITALGEIDIDIVEPQALVTAKAVRNSFLATKVAFFNEIYDYCRAYNIDYESVAGVVGDDSRITKSHTQITDERGFGGHCFPKDTTALTTSAKRQGVELSILDTAIKYNQHIRKGTT
jgi:UDPglucose 6-dehydrogenase